MKFPAKQLVAVVLLTLASKAHAAEHPAQVLVTNIVTQVLAIMNDDSEGISKDEKYYRDNIESIVFPHIDFSSMTRRIVGKHWRQASDEQREELVDEFKLFLLNTYTVAVGELDGQVEFKPYREVGKENQAIVKSQFSAADSFTFPVDYWLIKNEDWKIVNLVVGELNVVTNYRNSFASLIESEGIEGLIAQLKEKNS